MKTDSYAVRVFVVSLVTTLVVPPVNAQSMNAIMPPSQEMSFEKPVDIPVVPKVDLTGIGTIAGVVRTPAGLPAGSAMVTATRVDGTGIRSTVSNRDGVYAFNDLPAGQYRVTTDVIGDAVALTPPVVVTNGHATRFDLGGIASAAAPAVAISADKGATSPVTATPTPVRATY